MLVIGVDLGTQSAKAVVCDETLTVRGAHAIPITTSYPAPGCAEQDPRAWETAVAQAIAGALAAAGVSGDDIDTIAFAGQLDGCVAVDAHGEPLHPALIWQDRRAVADATRVPAAELFARTGQVADPSHLAAKARWLRARVPHVARVHQPVSYLVERFTNAAVLDPAHASTTMLFGLDTHAWDPVLLDAFELPATILPRVTPATAIAGTMRRLLPPHVRVAVGTGDDFATPLGAGLAVPGGPVIAAIGTAEVVGALAATAVRDPAAEPMVETHAYPTGAFFVENPGWLAGGAVRWATQLLGLASDAELDTLASQAPPGAGGVTFLPALAGAMTPVWRPHARGTLHGLAASHDRTHVARAVLEGLACATRDVVERLASIGLATSEVLLLGGGSRSATWAQIRADLLGRPHLVAASRDTCALGAAMIALVAAGAHADLAAAARLAPPPAARVDPAGTDGGAYDRYQRLVRQIAPLADDPWDG